MRTAIVGTRVLRSALVAGAAALAVACTDSLPVVGGLDAWPEVDARLDAAVTAEPAGVPCTNQTAEACGLELRFSGLGDPWYDQIFGDWERDRRVPIASASKWLTAATIMTVVDQGLLDLDEPIATYWPGLDAAHAAITLRQLLSHTSGILHQQPCVNDQIVHTLQQCAAEILATPLAAEPGTMFLYGAGGMAVAGALAERVSGRPWRELFEDGIAAPLGMTRTAYGSTQGQYEDTTQNPQLAGGGISTASDYYAFLSTMLQRGVYEGRRVLSERSWEEMRRDNTAGVRRIECPLSEQDCRAYWTGAVGFAVGNPDPDHVAYGLGNWLYQQDEAGRGTLMTSPGAYGVHGWIDLRRAYRGLLFMDGDYVPGKAIFDDILPMIEARVPVAGR